MLKPINYSDPKRRPIVATRRTMIWIEGSRFQGSGCSECSWVFRPSGPPTGDSLSEMKDWFERRRENLPIMSALNTLDRRMQVSEFLRQVDRALNFNYHARFIPPVTPSLPRNPASLSRRPHGGRPAKAPDTSSTPPPPLAAPSFSLGRLLCCRRSTRIL